MEEIDDKLNIQDLLEVRGLKLKKDRKYYLIDEYDAHCFAGMMLAHLGHPKFVEYWKYISGLDQMALMFLDLIKQHPMEFKDEEIEFVKKIANVK